jgi:hypothetical protein
MPQYDPQRSRSRQRKADDEGPAPVDALLGPAVDAIDEHARPLTDDIVAPPSPANLGGRTVAPGVAAIMAIMGLAVVTWVVLRRRRRARTD